MKKYILFVFILLLSLSFIIISCTPEGTPITTTTISTTLSDLDKVIAYKCVGSDAIYYVFINSDKVTRGFNVADGLSGAICVVDSKTSGITEITKPVGVKLSSDKKKVYLDPVTSAIFKKSK